MSTETSDHRADHPHRVKEMDDATRGNIRRSRHGRYCTHCQNQAEFAVKSFGQWRGACAGHSAQLIVSCDQCQERRTP